MWFIGHPMKCDLLTLCLSRKQLIAMMLLNHKDPFDRILTAQALSENILIVSADIQLDSYGVTRFW